jgi:DNA-binding transcriptional LysR family regulator
MNLRRLDYFVAVAEERHFRRAAERLHVAQPALSVQIAKLEQELGVALFERNRRGVELSAAGTVLLRRARTLLPTLRDAFAEALAVGQGRAGRLVVGFVGSTAYELLPRVLRLAERALPNVQIALRQLTSPLQVEALEAGRIDLGVARVPGATPALASTRIAAEPFVVALSARHPLLRHATLAARLLDDAPLVTLPADAGALRDAMLGELAESGACPRIVDEVSDMPTILGLVAAGRGVALVPASVASLRLGGVVFRPLRAPKRQAELWLLKRRDDHRPMTAALAALVSKATARPAPNASARGKRSG